MISKRRALLVLAWLWPLEPALAQPPQAANAMPSRQVSARDGQRDFDFEIGNWRTELRYLQNPLSGDPERWIDYRGISIVQPFMDGDANVVELDVAGAPGRIRGVSLRLYNPQTRQWSLNFASKRSGRLTAPVHGGFDAAGRGLFFGRDDVDGRVVLVRFVITPENRDRIRFVQSFSADAGATWQDNWIAVDTRLPARP